MKSAEFKKLVTKHLKPKLLLLGYSGAGFEYRKSDETFLYCVGIQPDRYGASCFVELGIQPRALFNTAISKTTERDCRYFDCELRARLSPSRFFRDSWEYGDSESSGIRTIASIYKAIRNQAEPAVVRFKKDPALLLKIEVADLKKSRKHLGKKLLGVHSFGTEIRLAWALALLHEKSGSSKARDFAEFAIAASGPDSQFLGLPSLRKLL